MSTNNPDLNIVKNVRTIEWLKAELLSAIGALFILDALTHLIMVCYFLGKRLGFSYAKIDARIEQCLEAPEMQEHEIEEWYGDITNLQQYVKERNRY